MERRNLALLCAGVVCFWLFALAFGTAQDSGLRWVEAPAAAQTAAAEAGEPAALTAAQPDLTLNCRAVCLIDQDTGTVLYEKNADQQMPIASITKVMTLLLTFEAIHDGRLTLDTLVPVSEHAYHMGGSQIWLEPGEQFTLDEMIKAICVSSANDAAVAVAELVGGSEQGFVQMMNDRAAELGMTNTTFHNACGLDTEGHLSTARDVAIMSRQILTTCPEVLHYTGIWTDTLRGGATQLVNTNKLLRRYNGITGLKTGTTGGAGVCISASATRDGLNLIAVVLGAPSSKDRFEAATTLLDYGFAAWRAAPLPAMEDRPLLIKVRGSAEESVPLEYSALPESILMPKESAAELTAQLTLPDELDAPVQQGQAVGMVRILAGESVLGEYDICAAADAPEMDFGTALGLLWGTLTGQSG
ncbi:MULTISPECIES: D-alanyl-D-alanine carboxypeptidase family protein [Faecalibacterium]|uniref:D-alanyl-D-alanine carboxypeptidase n=1 Tax=Faecalibacterium langellae TaxID=3435293 RepID=A0ACC9D329_9FIRM|nr:D-alanyl-D-alanine carboxypeptidase family protein [Faecalibacterium prausnitzii]MDU8690901.1 D-alanyl-D-alanine carboxypeptidase family protein [Faecalibacterium prausnitzii]PDX62249.1 D-alanyl-D-alanine carboxypeptidase [Faecalibacterium prausnitzii]